MEVERNNQVSQERSIAIPKLILASASPRRAEILRSVGWPFEALPAHIDESHEEGEKAGAYVERIALAKAEAAATHSPGSMVLGADTVVVIEDQILGKPRDEGDANRMLRVLNGRRHQVLTGVALVNDATGQSRVAHEVTDVTFAEMSEEEINWYVSTSEPMDKAGAYAIQGHGALFIKEIRGDYFNVVGLPVRLLYTLVSEVRL
jgi:septum formation protein